MTPPEPTPCAEPCVITGDPDKWCTACHRDFVVTNPCAVCGGSGGDGRLLDFPAVSWLECESCVGHGVSVRTRSGQ